MIELLILAIVVTVILAAALFLQADRIAKERRDWVKERRFLTDRAIARHGGDVVAYDRSASLLENPANGDREERPVRPLLEGLS